MESERPVDLAGRGEVDYVFRNQTDKDVETIVAFPMPDIDGNRTTTGRILPDDTSDNFLGFEVTVDGKAVKPSSSRRPLRSASTSPKS